MKAPADALTDVSRILVADDEAHIREVVRYTLERDGHDVELVGDGAAALARLDRGGIALLVLDVLMPELDGLSVCRRVRARGGVPILVLSSRGEEADRIVGLDLGADDYVTKPFSPGELAARVRALLRRHAEPVLAPPPPLLRRGRLAVDRAAHEVRVDDTVVPCTVTELRLLAALLEHPGRALSRAQLIACAYPGEHHVTDRTIDTHVRNIRAKLVVHDLDPIETVHGLGYRAR
jgi:two-component system OmpR family response regulator